MPPSTMASSNAAAGRFFIPLLLIVLTQLGLLSVSVAGRPCKTLFVSYYSFSIRRGPISDPNPNPTRGVIFLNLRTSDASSSSSGFLTISTNSYPAVRLNPGTAFPSEIPAGSSQTQRLGESKRDDTSGFFDWSFLGDRSKDILSVLSLLFGVGCGVLTAFTLYVAWTVLSNGGGHYLQESDDGYDSDASPKKMGYVKIPAPDPAPIPSKA